MKGECVAFVFLVGTQNLRDQPEDVLEEEKNSPGSRRDVLYVISAEVVP